MFKKNHAGNLYYREVSTALYYLKNLICKILDMLLFISHAFPNLIQHVLNVIIIMINFILLSEKNEPHFHEL